MNEDLIIPVVAIVFNFSAIIIWVYLFYTSRHRERMALIEKGQDATIFRATKDVSQTLKYGIVAILTGFGVIMGYFLESAGLPGFVAYFSMILIFGGTGLVGFYFYMQKGGLLEEQL